MGAIKLPPAVLFGPGWAYGRDDHHGTHPHLAIVYFKNEAALRRFVRTSSATYRDDWGTAIATINTQPRQAVARFLGALGWHAKSPLPVGRPGFLMVTWQGGYKRQRLTTRVEVWERRRGSWRELVGALKAQGA